MWINYLKLLHNLHFKIVDLSKSKKVKKLHFSPEKAIFLPKNSLFRLKITFFSEKTEFFKNSFLALFVLKNRLNYKRN
ncbi:MAG: hypothetical protein CL844_09315 [Crocinitomicaceae bacterium]|nr:hypothetical protein [Crocinitomicaceae bacterium]